MREMPIETTARCHLSPTKMAAISKVLARVQRNWNPVHLVGPAAENHVEVPQESSTTPHDQQSCCATPNRTESRGPDRFVHLSQEVGATPLCVRRCLVKVSNRVEDYSALTRKETRTCCNMDEP